MSNPLDDFEKMRDYMASQTGYPPNCIMLGGDAARADGLEPGVYQRQADGTMKYFTFEEWWKRP